MGKLRKRAASGYATSVVSLPKRPVRPLRELMKRALLAFMLLMVSTVTVFLDRDAYVDNVRHDGVSFIDALYYSTVTMTTTGYGDITPQAPHARLLNAILITPMRVGFLVVLVGTTIAVLADAGSRTLRDLQWRRHMRNHIVVIGYGTKGRSAVNTLRRQSPDIKSIVVIDINEVAVNDANLDGLAAFLGDGTRRDLLRRAEVSKARKVIICLSRDDAAILTTLTVRQLNPGAAIIVSVREHDNVALVRQSGATSVVTSSDTVGRMLGLSAVGPELGELIQDLLTAGTGLEIHQRQALPAEVGMSPADIPQERVIGIIRGGTMRRFYDSTAQKIQTGDQLIVVRRAQQRVLAMDED